ncbi:prepilin-type N-terminal cleavage/methylation domain-containing protein [Shewanella psychrophila]|uniref:Prepilin-type N-terminal cleavage/methylation domain-containing protein n=1 Tax=Shewanella psychrophila TaxID=225848 RepID=A0A1S6HXW0_9GAMM|nr:type II secretion system protein [Shewanella psychrophila]AQS40417.1 prepilin-type N-terminal cleavage/methylation domain-containing protein [Shewanella psychrophila]
MKKQNGFTLIELVVVIIILGILAVTAAPKFINLQGDARESSLQGMKGAIQGANSLVFAKAALAGDESESGPTDVNIGTNTDPINISTTFGYMTAEESEFELGMDAGFDAEGGTPQNGTQDWIVVEDGTPGTDGTMIIYQRGAPNGDNTCQLTYTEATSTTLPTMVIVDTGC